MQVFKRTKYLIPLAVLYLQVVYGQIVPEEALKIDLNTISKVNAGNSYITFGGGIGNIESLWFEGNIIPNFILRHSDDSRLMYVVRPFWTELDFC